MEQHSALARVEGLGMSGAFLLAIDRYAEKTDLTSAKADVRSMRSLCESVFNIPSENIFERAGECDHYLIPVLVKAFCDGASNQDVCLFYYSGHGGTTQDRSDFVLYGSDDQPTPLSSLINCLTGSFAHVLVVLDSCCSGSARVGAMSFDFVNQSSSAVTVVCSSGPAEYSYSGNQEMPSLFTRVFELVFRNFIGGRRTFVPVSDALAVLQELMGAYNSKHESGSMHPVVHNGLGCDAAFPTGLAPYEKAKPCEFEYGGYSFSVNQMNSSSYRRLCIFVTPNAPSPVNLDELLSVLDSAHFMQAVQTINIFENEQEERRLAGKPLANVEFKFFPDEFDRLTLNPQWCFYWNNPDVPHSDLGDKSDYEYGSLLAKENGSYCYVREGCLSNRIDALSLARQFSALYLRLLYAADLLRKAYESVLNGECEESLIADRCHELRALVAELNEEALDIPFVEKELVLEEQASHLIGMAGSLVNAISVYEPLFNHCHDKERRLELMEIYLGQCAKSHRLLFIS